MALLSLGFRAGRRRGPGPLVLGSLAAAAIVAGKFFVNVPLLAYAGAAVLLAASIWNAWPRRPVSPTRSSQGGFS